MRTKIILRFCCFCALILCVSLELAAQHPVHSIIRDQYDQPVEAANVKAQPSGTYTVSDSTGAFTLPVTSADSIVIDKAGYNSAVFHATGLKRSITMQKSFSWKELLNPLFYIKYGGLWLLIFIVFAETGLMVGFFLPGDSLLFVAGIYSSNLIATFPTGSLGGLPDLLLLWVLISIAGILGNMAGYWFGRKSGPFLYTRKETFFFKRKHLVRAKGFYDKHGGQAIVFARFLPIIRTFAPIVAGIVDMDKKKFLFYNTIGSAAWVFSMLFAGHYLQKLFLRKFNFDLTRHLEPIVIVMVLITTLPVIYKLFFGKREEGDLPEITKPGV